MAEGRFRQIAVAIDGSSHGAAALEVAVDLALKYRSELVILSVAPLVPVYVVASEPYLPSVVPDAEFAPFRALVDEGVKRARAAGVSAVSGVCEQGVVVDEILIHLERHPADLLVVGSRGLSAARRLLLGSVSSALVAHAPCAVLVVRQPATPPST